MADDQTQRPYRSNDATTRAASPKPQAAGASGSDPLAELARLIGQTDPFSEYGGRDSRRPVPAAEQRPEPPPEWLATPAHFAASQSVRGTRATSPAPAAAPEAEPYSSTAYGRQPYGGSPLANGDDLYQLENEVAGYAAQQQAAEQPGAYAFDDRYDPNTATPELEQPDFYDDEPPPRRRLGVVVIAGVFALAVVGTAGAFGYRALFGSSGSSAPPPVIKAESAPSKIIPVAGKDANKQITDRINGPAQSERLVSREERPRPIEVRDPPTGNVFPPAQEANSSSQPMGSGIVGGGEPKRIRTIAIRPDQQASADANAIAVPQPPQQQYQPPQQAMPAAPTSSASARITNITPARQPAMAEPEPAPATIAAPAPRPAPPVRQAAPVAAAPSAPAPAPSANAPLSLNPNAQAAAPAARAPVRTASVSNPGPASSGNGGIGVQVSSQRSEADAQAAFRSLQAKFPDQLGNRAVEVRRADLGDKGVYYRAVVGVGSGAEATELCTALKAAGGSCIIQRN